MSLNDTQLAANKAVDIYPGVANPTPSSVLDPMHTNFVTDPTTDTLGAGASANFTGQQDAARNFKQTAGVVEGRPGIIESTHIDPLSEHSNDADGWANARSAGTGATRTGSLGGVSQTAYETASSVASGAASVASNAAQTAYKYVAGEDQSRRS
ncbi:hypothetical protein BD309DRAFT_856928 [Dichomitus squalens]|uniref:Uncharacterized protein n=1 Tax=Dichomitus squalens TaxID=114155 RepID=A0A4Q9NZH4_9APHY|nr:hypothetical protein BD309DRAFT_856928 [Dichomitus squalens]TBU60699.1 hypothetical protein BD310DRAFT_947194 [Dichomitus squalens]